MAEDSTEFRDLARTRLRKRRDFTSHLVSYLIINAFLVGLWALTGAGYFWPAWVLLGWGVGLVFNAWDVFFRRPISEDDVEREMRRMRPENR
jgi:fatty acid desaturase